MRVRPFYVCDDLLKIHRHPSTSVQPGGHPSSHSTTRLDVTDLSAEQVETIRTLALKAFTQLKLKGLSRVDFFLTSEGEILLNEINTFPGMTPISMFPKMLQHHGHDFGQFLLQNVESAVSK